MKVAGWILFVVGTLVMAAAGAPIPPLWTLFGVGAVVALGGAVMLRRVARTVGASDGGHGIDDEAGLRRGLEQVAAETGELVDQGDAMALKAGVERVLLDRLLPVVEARLVLAAGHGVEAYARVFTPVASGERCLNRAWSALVDGCVGEARVQVSAARAWFDEALDAWPTPAETGAAGAR